MNENYETIIGKKRYSVADSTLLAEIHITTRSKGSRYLYKTKNGAYFEYWAGINDTHRLKPISEDQAIGFWEQANRQCVEFSVAFPDVKIEDA